MRRHMPIFAMSRRWGALRCSLFGFAARWMEVPGDTDADEVETEHRNSVDAHGPGIGAGGDDGGHQEYGKNRVADVFPEKAWAHDAEERQEEDEDRHFKTDAKAKNDGEEEAGVLLNGDHGIELAAEVNDEDFESSGKHEEIAEAGAQQKESDSGA